VCSARYQHGMDKDRGKSGGKVLSEAEGSHTLRDRTLSRRKPSIYDDSVQYNRQVGEGGDGGEKGTKKGTKKKKKTCPICGQKGPTLFSLLTLSQIPCPLAAPDLAYFGLWYAGHYAKTCGQKGILSSSSLSSSPFHCSLKGY